MKKTESLKKTKVLIVMDGFGIPKNEKRSGITRENTKNLQTLAKTFPSTTLFASEGKVGLPDKQTGTSEVGHLIIGAGRLFLQPIVRINKAIQDKSFFSNPKLLEAMENAKRPGKSLHLIGIPSDGGVHSHISHLFACMRMAKKQGVKNVFIHFISDGRDTPQKSAKEYVKQVLVFTKKLKLGQIVNLMGRMWPLDRDKNWDRNKVAYDAMVNGIGKKRENLFKAIDEAYETGETDEFIKPIILTQNGKAVTIKKGDSVISYNFRADRERQLTYIFAEKNEFEWAKDLKLKFVCMMEYDNTFKRVEVAFKNEPMKNILSEVVSNQGMKQAKVAETEKYSYVAFNFNAGRQEPFKNEERFIFPSDKIVSFAEKPEMKVQEITGKTIELVKTQKYDLIVINFANCDMVGHTGNKVAARIATKTVDEGVKKVVDAVFEVDGEVLVIADHGNADIMEYKDGSPHTSHTSAKVPCILVSKRFAHSKLKKKKTLADVAPTLLELLGIEKPAEMTGETLIEHA